MLNKLINKKNKNSQSGFTIIEVLIVLAIAALILVVVIIAIPQLQRNQRNSARQNDAARVGTTVSNWISNNNGKTIPTTAVAGSAAFLDDIANDLGDLSQYVIQADNANNTLQVIAGVATVAPLVANFNNIRIVSGAVCTTNGAASSSGSAPRQFVVQFQSEDSSGTPQGACLEV